MNRDSLVNNFLNGQSTEEFVATLIWGLIGLLFSLLLELAANKEKIKKNGGFSVAFWIQDNLVRVIASLLLIFIGSAYGEAITSKVGEFGCLGLGFMTDKVIEGLIKVKKTVKLNFSFFKKS